jgi:BirA family biotin operon repressor/biotin-[acetyl-CoA-carboxylase] ligase
MTTRIDVLRLLADGAFHSGTALGEQLGISRAAVNKAVQSLGELGVEVHRVTGRGYRLAHPTFPLSVEAIRENLPARARALPMEVLEETDSTSQHLLRRLAEGAPPPQVCFAECQTAGRGRRGRAWLAGAYRNLMFSVSWRFEAGPAALTGLSLAAGVAVVRGLSRLGVQGAALKWPNDVLLDGRKLGGLLIDLRGEAAGPSAVVLGAGLNVAMDETVAAEIDQPWSDLASRLPLPIDRNRLAAALLEEIVAAFESFARSGLTSFREEWEHLHVHRGREVRLILPTHELTGTALGIDANGGLRLRDARGIESTHYSGEVSLRGLA